MAIPAAPGGHARPASGLLEHITATSLDEDYTHVADRRRAAVGVSNDPVHDSADDSPSGAKADSSPGTGTGTGGGSAGSRPRSAPLLAVLAAFGLMLTTAAVQTARTASSQQRSRESLVAQVQDRRAELTEARDELRGLRRAISRTARSKDTAAAAARDLEQRVRRLGAAAGTVAVTGPGVRITVDDRPDARTERQVVLDEDLQRLVNGLWLAGAEAVAINGERLTALSAVRGAGEAITVNFRSLRRPYVVRAVGDPDDLPARFIESAGGTWWLNLRSVYQLRFDMSSEDSVTLPAAPPPALRHVRDARRGER